MTYQVLTCPNCGGKGCPTCQNTGKVRVSSEQLQKIKTLAKQLGQTATAPHFGSGRMDSPGVKTPAWSTNISGIIAWSILAILSGSATASWYFLRTLKPFLAGLTTILVLIGTRLAWKQPFFALQEPDDFLKAIKK
ncbi:hypothetical protein KKH13_03315 [Patescibacteria group bacterium]|nr:hypothetical protein [Patescibacteria group bacterium]